jgi:hypothetical protein
LDGWVVQYVNGCGVKMTLVERLKAAHSFHGDPLHREAWEEIERLEKELYLLTTDYKRVEVNLGAGYEEENEDY